MTKSLILVVDDKSENVYVMRALLEGHGYAVESAEHGAEALAVARRSPPALVISDILMPVMDGFAFCREWRADPLLAPIPFMFYSAVYTEGQDEAFAMKQGADLFVVKPAEPEEILDGVRTLLDRASARGSAGAETGLQPEMAYLREYNEVLIRKLEAKVEELEKRNVELARKERMKSHFLTVAAHELHTPVTCVLGYAEILKRQSDSRMAHALGRGVDRLANVTRTIIQMTKAESEDLPAVRTRLDLNELVDERASNLRAFTTHRNQEMVVELAPCRLPVTADPDAVGQAIENLVLNAIRFTPDQGRITIRTDRDGAAGVVTVTDTGIGIPEDEHERIFEKFYQIKDVSSHHSGTTEFLSGGLGLGLSIARANIERHAGTIEVRSREGEGSAFIVRLPLGDEA